MARGRHGSGRRPDYAWAGIGDSLLAVDPGAAAQTLGSSSLLAVPQTLVRLRGRIFAQLDAAAVDERIGVIVGVGVFDTDQVTAGAFPEFTTDGATEEFGGWMWVGTLFVSSGAEGAIVNEGLFDRIDVDSKAMRRVKPNEQVVVVVEAPSALAVDQGGTVDVLAHIRCLSAS